MAANQPAVSVTDEYLPCFQDLMDRLQAAEWYQDGWAGGTWVNEGRNSGVTINRPRWETGNALHLETWLGNADAKREFERMAGLTPALDGIVADLRSS